MAENMQEQVTKPRTKKEKAHRHKRKRAQAEAILESQAPESNDQPAKKLKTDTDPAPAESASKSTEQATNSQTKKQKSNRRKRKLAQAEATLESQTPEDNDKLAKNLKADSSLAPTESAPKSTEAKPAACPESETNANSPSQDQEANVAPDADAAADKASHDSDPDPPKPKDKFVVFVGNLPFGATESHIATHLKHVYPTSIRLRTNKADGKSKGFAFVEFDRFDRMKTCLKLYHHSKLSDGKSPARRINVELTAGGGGHGQNRQTKIKDKNDKLNEERKREADRRMRERLGGKKPEEKADGEDKVKKDKEGEDKVRKKKDGKDKAEENNDDEDTGGMHPSRMNRIKVLGRER